MRTGEKIFLAVVAGLVVLGGLPAHLLWTILQTCFGLLVAIGGLMAFGVVVGWLFDRK